MRMLFAALTFAFAAAAALPALAADTCEAQATQKKLAGAAKTSFLKKCEADAGTTAAPADSSSCEAKADDKKLAGAARTSFVKKCVADAGASDAAPTPATTTCEAKAAEKKLAGAAKTSFVKKCVADAK